MGRLIVLLCALVVGGCAGSFEEAKLAGRPPTTTKAAVEPSDYCKSLDAKQRDWQAAAELSGALAGATGLATIPDYGERAARIGLAFGIVGAGAVAVSAAVISHGAAASWARDCAEK